MTASKTPRLGLMNPVGSDAFQVQDFSDSMAILDGLPGILPVPNAASRPSNYTAAQHGSIIHQTDLGILWTWYQPTSGVTGQWKRLGNVGLLGVSGASGLVTATTTTATAGAQLAALTVTVPGGRPLMIKTDWDQLGNTYNKSVLSYWENNTLISSRVFGGAVPPAATPNTWMFATGIPTNSFTLNAKITISCFSAAPPNGGGTASANGVSISIWEL